MFCISIFLCFMVCYIDLVVVLHILRLQCTGRFKKGTHLKNGPPLLLIFIIMKYVQSTLVQLLFMRETPSAKNMFNFSCVCLLYPSYFIIVQCFNIMKNCKTEVHTSRLEDKSCMMCVTLRTTCLQVQIVGGKGWSDLFSLIFLDPIKEKIKQTI